MTVDLERFFGPRTVAVVGASDSATSASTMSWRLIRRWADRVGATIHPVNPRRDTVDGLPCWPSLSSVPDRPDVVAVLIGDPLPTVTEAAKIGAGFVVVFSSGFAEVGEAGRLAQLRLRAAVTGTSTRLIGPNTNLNSFEEFRTDLDGPAIALISQSGHQGRPLFMLQENGVRVSHWAPTGNEADLETADFIEWFAAQPDIGCVAAYIEGFTNAGRFVEAAHRATELRTPITLVKVGRTAAGRSAATTHTGKLAGSDRVTTGLFQQLGVTRVDTLDQLADTAQILARGPRPASDGVAVYSISGGTGAHLADLCGMADLRLAEFSAATISELRRHIPDYLSVSNPVDCGGHPVGDERGPQIIRAILDDPDVGVLLCPITGPFPPLSDKLAADLVAAAEHTDKLVCVVWGSPVGTEAALRDVLLASSRTVVFRSSGNAVRSIGAWIDWHRYLDRVASEPEPAPAPRPSPPAVEQVLGETRGALDEHRAMALIDAYGVPVPRLRMVQERSAALLAADELGYPVVLKACGAALEHKSELGLVRTGIGEPATLATSFDEMVERGQQSPPLVEGYLVCEQIRGEVEAVVGVVRDPEFGPAIMVGLGGVLVEVFDDVAFRVPPFSRSEATRMVDGLRGARILRGTRGRPPCDVDALIDVVMKVQQLVLDLGDRLQELDLNPVILRAAGEGAVAVDALVVLNDGTGSR